MDWSAYGVKMIDFVFIVLEIFQKEKFFFWQRQLATKLKSELGLENTCSSTRTRFGKRSFQKQCTENVSPDFTDVDRFVTSWFDSRL